MLVSSSRSSTRSRDSPRRRMKRLKALPVNSWSIVGTGHAGGTGTDSGMVWVREQENERLR